MTRLILAAVISMGLTLATASAMAQPASDQGSDSVSETIAATGTVRSIDRQTRAVTLEMANGKQLTVDAPADFSLDSVKVGDRVDVEYTEAVAFALQPPGSPMSGPTEQLTRQKTEKGTIRTRVVTAVAEVLAVDPLHNEVTFRGPRGNTRTIAVQDPAMQEKARQLKPGDKVQFTYTEAAALSIRPAHSKR